MTSSLWSGGGCSCRVTDRASDAGNLQRGRRVLKIEILNFDCIGLDEGICTVAELCRAYWESNPGSGLVARDRRGGHYDRYLPDLVTDRH